MRGIEAPGRLTHSGIAFAIGPSRGAKMGLGAFDWLRRADVKSPATRASRSEESVIDLVARRKYPRAIAILRSQFEAGNRSPDLRLQYADVLILSGKAADAVPVLIGVADELAGTSRDRAIQALRRAAEVEPGREEVVMRLATLGVSAR
jgi:hypothetical protein